MAFYNLEIAKSITGIEDENLLKFYFDAILEKIENIIGYKLQIGPREEFVKGINTDEIYLTSRPIISVEEVLYQNRNVTDKTIIKSTRKISLNTVFCQCDELSIKYTSGYVELPKNIQIFIFEQIILAGTRIDEAGLKSYSIKDISYTYVSDLDKNKNFINSLNQIFGGIYGC
ncbi:MAG: hypothetical protein ACRDAS_12270 [Cetobacterium sp.]